MNSPRLLNQLRLQAGKPSGFSILELLIAAVLGTLVTFVAGEALVNQLRLSARAEALERQRTEWSRSTHFIESEIALSQQVITTAANIAIPAACTNFTNANFRMALDIRHDLPPAIYAVLPSDARWLPNNSLWRCGPQVQADGTYNTTITPQLIVDGLDGQAAGSGFTAAIDAGTNNRSATFSLSLRGLPTIGYAGTTYSLPNRTIGRVSPQFRIPREGSVCDTISENAPPSNVLLGTSAANTLNASSSQSLVCGRGGGDTITGRTADDVLEAGDNGAASITGNGGNDFMRGTNSNDTITGGSGADTLVGRGGNDTLNGGNGYNQYRPGPGTDTVNGGTGVDVVYFSGSQSDYTISGSCTSAGGCTVTDNRTTADAEGTNTLNNVNVIIFSDGRIDVP